MCDEKQEQGAVTETKGGERSWKGKASPRWCQRGPECSSWANSMCKDSEAEKSSMRGENLKETKGGEGLQGWALEEFHRNVTSLLYPVSVNSPFPVNLCDIRYIEDEFQIKWERDKERQKMNNLG